MKPTVEPAASDAAVDAAIAKVLAAERDARAALEASRNEAAEIAAQSRLAARRIVECTERRIRAVRSAFERRAAVQVAAAQAETAQLDIRHDPSTAELGHLDRAIDALAAELTGGNR